MIGVLRRIISVLLRPFRMTDEQRKRQGRQARELAKLRLEITAREGRRPM